MEWQPIETAPKDGTYIDLWVSGPYNKGCRITDCWFECGQWWKDYGRDGELKADQMKGDEPTHWMPIPDGPAWEK